ncbi:methyltransferase [Alteromonas sp. 1_MG-2023]|uniref:tRNA1(Val) (adenine(37)-N6)-methyltransferase n=1 Tax=Alteromonas sp. 1_MG-2023 TaxID=3062669 RepID=UPI0026E296CD|nr:methyltransferase [Alteromonas sp. 1_MG-2023]MDO6568224.1 methyltransferase [Alteromonas sp. 1_MG-2023]
MFRCKQFVVHQHNCAMKVNTDSLILGSWLDATQSKVSLDIGTGTGILALMLAQKTSTSARIQAIDIDEGAVRQASENVAESTWANKVSVAHCDLSQFSPSGVLEPINPIEPTQHNDIFDLIVCNPPYFEQVQGESRGFSTQSAQRKIARQTISLNPNTLFTFAAQHLRSDGTLYVVYPYSREKEIIAYAVESGLHLHKILRVRHNAQRDLYLSAFCFGKQTSATHQMSELIIRDEAGAYSSAFKELCRDFYIHF